MLRRFVFAVGWVVFKLPSDTCFRVECWSCIYIRSCVLLIRQHVYNKELTVSLHQPLLGSSLLSSSFVVVDVAKVTELHSYIIVAVVTINNNTQVLGRVDTSEAPEQLQVKLWEGCVSSHTCCTFSPPRVVGRYCLVTVGCSTVRMSGCPGNSFCLTNIEGYSGLVHHDCTLHHWAPPPRPLGTPPSLAEWTTGATARCGERPMKSHYPIQNKRKRFLALELRWSPEKYEAMGPQWNNNVWDVLFPYCFKNCVHHVHWGLTYKARLPVARW